jgi:hypothetical protein
MPNTSGYTTKYKSADFTFADDATEKRRNITQRLAALRRMKVNPQYAEDARFQRLNNRDIAECERMLAELVPMTETDWVSGEIRPFGMSEVTA